MKWNNHLLEQFANGSQIKNIAEKQIVADTIADRVKSGDVIGVGSGSTSLMAIQSISRRLKSERLDILVIPTSTEMNFACQHFGLSVTDIVVDKPIWCFDGADEVDENTNLNKGRGGALYKEKLMMSSCQERYILIDNSKKVKHLGTNFPIPIEVQPSSVSYVKAELDHFGLREVSIRLAGGKDGPVYSENNCLLLDAWFDEVYEGLEKDIKSITGVLESGLFQGFDPTIITS